jgi:SAM-dependent methyltransferase
MNKVNTTYEPFAREPEYLDSNREFLQSLPLDSVRRVLDLACGTGTLTELLLELRPHVAVIGMDLSREQIEIGRKIFRAKQLLADSREAWSAAVAAEEPAVLLLEGDAQEIAFDDVGFDLVMMGNSIHLMPDKDGLLQSIRRALRPQGLFAFNSVFFVGTYPEGAERIYTEWMKESYLALSEMDEEWRRAGRGPIPRKRGTHGRAFDKGWLSPQQWADLLTRNGFEVRFHYKRLVNISQQGLEAVAAYGGLSEVLMSGYPVEVASAALRQGVGRAFRKLGVTVAPRYWLEMNAVKA